MIRQPVLNKKASEEDVKIRREGVFCPSLGRKEARLAAREEWEIRRESTGNPIYCMGADQRRARGWYAKARGHVIFAGDVEEKERTGRKKPVEVFCHLWGNER